MKNKLAALLLVFLTVLLTGCGGAGSGAAGVADPAAPDLSGPSAAQESAADPDAPVVDGLIYASTMKLDYAECFDVYFYEGGYAVVEIDGSRGYLVVPEGAEVPAGAEGRFLVLRRPLDRIYLAATSAMCLFDALDGLSGIRFSGTRADGWYIESAVRAMEEGDILYAGKYNAPDYELILSGDCDLAVESTMILHSPKVQEKLEELGVPVWVDLSSREPEPLGRTEWIKAYAVLLGKEAQAEEVFAGQKRYAEELAGVVNTEKTVAFFYVNSGGAIVTKKSADYIPKMIEMAGGRYVFSDLGDSETASSSVTMDMETFYAAARDADYLIYNASIDEPLDSVDGLLFKNELFADFKAVREGNVWCTTKYLYQASSVNGEIVYDIHLMLTSGDGAAVEPTFLYKLY
ncbi:MAG TPA: ABC transporter substrate-binding protein [Oscillospiraceae bacterium]|nr:ABC transporter substrate-binding protein [Oscillospiraceae bacterium]HNW03874.1 ABC transporter substrate-binding protein [Oscillospiraceae bacterium]